MDKEFTTPNASQRKDIINYLNKISDGHKFASIEFVQGGFGALTLEVWCNKGLMFDGTHCRCYYFDPHDEKVMWQEFKKWLAYDLETSFCDIKDCEYCGEQ